MSLEPFIDLTTAVSVKLKMRLEWKMKWLNQQAISKSYRRCSENSRWAASMARVARHDKRDKRLCHYCIGYPGFVPVYSFD